MNWLRIVLVSLMLTGVDSLSVVASNLEYLTIEQQRPRARPPDIRRPPVRRPPQRPPMARPNPENRQAMQRYYQMMEQRRERVQEMVQRVQEAKAEKKQKRYERLNRQLQERYGLSYVPFDDRIVLVRYREVVGVNLNDESRDILKRLGFRWMRRTELASVRLRMDLLLAPEGIDTSKAMQMLKEQDSKGQYRYNIAYAAAGGMPERSLDVGEHQKTPQPNLPIGMIDTGVRADHKLLKHLSIKQQNIGRGDTVTPRHHGTAVASIVSQNASPTIYVADVFSGPVAYADAEAIVVALNWLADHQIPLINVSLAGPHSDLLAYAVKVLVDKGHIIVAAVGNNGPEGAPLYPASYRGVVGVTAVDEASGIYEDAYQGPAVTVASYGVKVKAASLTGRKKYSGTSFAAPVVSRYLFPFHKEASKASALKSIKGLLNAAVDVGEKGYDEVYGFGIIKH